MSNQDFEGRGSADQGAGAPKAATPASLEQQLEKEREERLSIRDRLRHTEALAAESHALRARMAQELERVTADRDRLRTAAANSPVAATPAGPARPAPPVEPPAFTPRMASPDADIDLDLDLDLPLQPPPPPRRGPWRALVMLGGLAAGVAALAWITGTLPREPGVGMAAASAPRATAMASAIAVAKPASSAPALALAASGTPTAPVPPSPGAVALAPLALTPEQQLAAAPSAAGPAPVSTPAAASVDMPARLRKALDGEGIASPVEVDAATGHVAVADPQADAAARDRTDLVIRAVFAGASLPEPQIEHRWLSPRRGDHAAPAIAAPAPTHAPVSKSAQATGLSPAQAYAARHAASDHHHDKVAGATVADAEELRPVLPEGRVTAGCRASLAGKSTPHRADMTACMKHSCCSSAANHQAEDCRAYEKSYPFTCSAG